MHSLTIQNKLIAIIMIKKAAAAALSVYRALLDCDNTEAANDLVS